MFLRIIYQGRGEIAKEISEFWLKIFYFEVEKSPFSLIPEREVQCLLITNW